MNITKIKGRGEIIKDSKEQDYLAIAIDSTHFNDFRSIMNHLNLDLELENKLKRDRGEYHITFINVMEYNNLKLKNPDGLKEIKSKFLNQTFEIDGLGLGTINKDEQRTYYIVVEDCQLSNLISEINLPPKNFHITLGFNPKDLFHLPKDKTTIFKSADELNKITETSSFSKKLF